MIVYVKGAQVWLAAADAGEGTASGYTLPIRPDHIERAFYRKNLFTDEEEEEFDPVQIFTSPSIHYCALPVYCDSTKFKGRAILLLLLLLLLREEVVLVLLLVCCSSLV